MRNKQKLDSGLRFINHKLRIFSSQHLHFSSVSRYVAVLFALKVMNALNNHM